VNVCETARELQFNLGAALTNVAARLSLAYCKWIEHAPGISLILHAKTLAVVMTQGLHKGALTRSKISSNISKFEMQRFPVLT